jgi:hypothetical protein
VGAATDATAEAAEIVGAAGEAGEGVDVRSDGGADDSGAIRAAVVAAVDLETSARSEGPASAGAAGGIAGPTGSIGFEWRAGCGGTLDRGSAATSPEAGRGAFRRLAAGRSNRAAAARVLT